MIRTTGNSWTWLLLLALVLPFFMQSGASGQRRRPMNVGGQEPGGLRFRLSEGAAETQAAGPQASVPRADSLSDDAVQALLRRVPPMKDEGEEKEFAMRDRSLPPPRTGETIREAFPPAGTLPPPEPGASGPLEIARISPEGDIPLAPHLSVTFTQPMVPVTSNQDLAAAQPPVKLTPQPPGRWRWVGTKTLLFEPTGRFPMATAYTAEIPAGTKSATGNALGAARRWTFATPPPKIATSYPNEGPHPRDPVFFVEFDQRIDPAAVLKAIRLAAGNRTWPLRLATAQEIEADAQVRQLKSQAKADCWLAFRVEGREAERLLPAATKFTVTLDRGLPSAEGPRATTAPQSFQFSTYSPLRFQEHHCGYGRPCEPGWAWTLSFNNPLDPAAFDKKQIRIEPELPGAKISNFGSQIQIEGPTRGRTTYRVTVDAGLKDMFGQTLGAERTVTFNVAPASPGLGASPEDLAVLDPSANGRFSVYSLNHAQLRVTIYAVGPRNWPQFAEFMGNDQQMRYQRGGRTTEMPAIGRLVSTRVIDVANKPDEMVETQIDLKPALAGGLGHVLLNVEAVQPPRNEWERRSIRVWVQSTNIGLDVFADRTNLVAWATSLRDGKALGDARLTVVPEKQLGQANGEGVRAGNDGLARIPLTDSGGKRVLVARRGEDVAILPENFGWWDMGDGSQWRRREGRDELRWHVFDDRGMYRPGEEARVKGWLRRVGAGPLGDVGGLRGAATRVQYVLRDSRGNETLKGEARVDALGGFDFALKLPPTINLGQGWLALTATGDVAIENRQFTHPIKIQEFRRPEYEVKAQASEGPHFVGDFATVTVAARYYAGGGLANAETRWNVSATPTSYTPPNRGDFTFGKWTPWWSPYEGAGEQASAQQYTAHTDASGSHRLRIDFDAVTPPRPTRITAAASVEDVNRQAVSGTATLLVHPSAVYVGLRSPRAFVQKGEPIVVEAIATDLDGKALPGREIRLRAVRLDWAYEQGQWREVEANEQECVVKAGADAVQCRFKTTEGGRYRVVARVIDDRERPNESELTLWVAGGKQPPQRELAKEKVELIPSHKEYAPGETAEVLVQAPFFPAEGVLTIARSGLVRTERFTLASASHTLKIPIEEAYTPNVHVDVQLVGAAERTDDDGKALPNMPKRPAFASGEINLSIPPVRRRLAVAATPRDAVTEPGAETSVAVDLRDAAGKPVAGAEVAIFVVDEAVLALSNYQLADPMKVFYRERDKELFEHHLREKVQLAKPASLSQPQNGRGRGGLIGVANETVQITAGVADRSMMMMKAAPAAAMPMATPPPPPGESGEIAVRLNFDALATFAAAAPTDADGRATVKFKLPENLTRYRVMAVAAAGEQQFGTGESAITARLPLMVRPSAPRFLNFGDRFELPVVLQNQTDAPMQVDVAVRAGNARLTAGAGRRVTVPANDRVEVRFPTETLKPGTARFQIAGASGKWSDAAEVTLPVWTPATTEAFATYGEIDAGAILQPVQAPSDAFAQFGGLEITTSSTQLQALTDAVLYLTSYPYECAEQLSSRILAVAALRDVLGAFEAKGLPPADQLIAAVDRDLKRLEGMQNYTGGFGFWRRGDSEWPYLGIHAAHAMVRAKQKGFAVPPEMLQRSQNYLRNIESFIPATYGADVRRVLIAYSLHVRNLLGDRDAAKARRLIVDAGGVEKLPLEALGWVLPVLSGASEATAIRRHLGNRVEETAAAAHFTTSYSDGAHLLLHSDRRADGIVLEALIATDPANDLIPKIVRGLLGAKKRGRWENTQENCFILLALDRYFNAYEKVTPDFVARVWLGDAFAGSHEFRGRSTDRSQLDIPMRYLMAQPGKQTLAMSKDGAGRLYYRIGMSYAPTSLQLKPADYGFTVTRTYEAVDQPSDVRRDEDGAWHIKAGARVRVRLTMIAPTRRYHVALVDPLPAGLETVNPELAISGPIPQDPNDTTSGYWWRRWWNWFEHQNLRDERVEAFTSMLWEGVYNYTYVARATTPGVFVVPPAKAEEMYHPETFGRGASDRVVVE